MSVPDTPFWIYSLTTYGREDVAARCLALQDRFGLDVNLILLCCWLGSRSAVLDRVQANQAVVLADKWATPVIAPLRAVRRHLKSEAADENTSRFRKQLAALELDAEKIQQSRLYERFGSLPSNSDESLLQTTINNSMNYLTALGRPLEPPLRETLVKLFAAVFPGETEADIVSSLALSTNDSTI
ncbi:TIGR02444 family protein [Nisaea sp.]|uniref:TIGR02444 family protein n=1 Tax=Nisaea sp. TaxID=2024842 RepID=UPI0032998DB5